MAFKVFLFSTYFFAVVIQPFGKESWVQFVGIDKKIPLQNYARMFVLGGSVLSPPIILFKFSRLGKLLFQMFTKDYDTSA